MEPVRSFLSHVAFVLEGLELLSSSNRGTVMSIEQEEIELRRDSKSLNSPSDL